MPGSLRAVFAVPIAAAMLAAALPVTGAPWSAAVSASEIPNTLVIYADRARRLEGKSLTSFRGDFRLHAQEWSVTADEANVYGPIEDPERIVASGKPAHVDFYVAERDRRVQGFAQRIEYDRQHNMVRLEGDARLIEGDNSMSSGYIAYDVTRQQIDAAGPRSDQGRGVEMVIQPPQENASDTKEDEDNDAGDG